MANPTTKSDKDKRSEGMESFQQGTSNLADQAKSAAQNVAQNVGDKAKQAGEYARDKADQALSSAGKGMESLASTIRDRGPQEGLLGKATSGLANTLDRTGQYLGDQGVGGMVDDLTGMIRNHPVPAILIGIGIGFMLARLTTPSSRSWS